jgi:hypothetical protein
MLFFIFLFSSINETFAAKSQEFVDYLSNKIYEECKESDINIKEGFIGYVDADKNIRNITILEWPYNLAKIKEIVNIFIVNEPYPIFSRADENKEIFAVMGNAQQFAYKILTCGDHKLDINGYNYYWDGVKVELPRQKVDINISATSGGKATLSGDIVDLKDEARYTKTEGDFSHGSSGDDSPNIQSNRFIKLFTNIYFSISLVIMLGLSLTYSTILKVRFNKRKRF